jgi:hypothetical protein
VHPTSCRKDILPDMSFTTTAMRTCYNETLLPLRPIQNGGRTPVRSHSASHSLSSHHRTTHPRHALCRAYSCPTPTTTIISSVPATLKMTRPPPRRRQLPSSRSASWTAYLGAAATSRSTTQQRLHTRISGDAPAEDESLRFHF